MQNKQQRNVLILPCRVHDEPAQRQEGKQCRVVCEQHRAEHGDYYKHRRNAAHRAEGAHEPLRQRSENIEVTQGGDDGQHAEQARERFQIVVPQILRIRRHEKRRDRGKQQRDQQHRIRPAP